MTLMGECQQQQQQSEDKVWTELSASASNFSEEDARSFLAAPTSQQQHHYPLMNKTKLSLKDELVKSKRSMSSDIVTGSFLLDHIEMGDHAHEHNSRAAADEMRDDEIIAWKHAEGSCDDEDFVCDEEKQSMMSGCCDVSELQDFMHALRYLQCYVFE